MEKNIKLGLDIGTGTSSCGYLKPCGREWRYVSALVGEPRNEYEARALKHGVPTIFLYNPNMPEGKRFIFGIEAEQMLDQGIPEGWHFYLGAIKTELRNYLENSDAAAVFLPADGGGVTVSLTEVFKAFIAYLVARIKRVLDEREGKGWRIETVNFAYPNLQHAASFLESDSEAQEKTRNYINFLTSVIRESFEDISVENLRVNARTEGQIAAACLATMSASCSRAPLQRFCLVDVGAGTTDITSMQWQKKAYHQLGEARSTLFGGKALDRILFSYCDPNISAHRMIRNKQWLFTGEGKPILASGLIDYEKKHGREELAKVITQELKETSEWARLQATFEEHSDYVDGGAVLLLGGSSSLPCIKELVKEVWGNVDIFTLEDLDVTQSARVTGITRFNFISFAGAMFQLLGDIVTSSPEPFAVGLHTLANDYFVLADYSGASQKGYRYHMHDKGWIDCYRATREPAPHFDPSSCLYKITLKKPLNGKQWIRENEIEDFVATIEGIDAHTFSRRMISYNKPLPQDGWHIAYYLGTAYERDFTSENYDNVYLYHYQNNKKRTLYWDKNNQKKIGFKQFLRLAKRCERGKKCPAPGAAATKYCIPERGAALPRARVPIARKRFGRAK